MYNIEVLPNSSSALAPGWAYVLDTQDLQSNPTVPPAGRGKRVHRNVISTPTNQDINNVLRQNTAILHRLAELDKDSSRDSGILAPVRQRDGASKASRVREFGVRRILMSNKTFANHLADEEASLANASNTTGGFLSQYPSPAAMDASKKSKRGQASHGGSSLKKPYLFPAASSTSLAIKTNASVQRSSTSIGFPNESIPLGDSILPISADLPSPQLISLLNTKNPCDGLSDSDQVKVLGPLSLNVKPSEELLEALISTPPLSYLAARAESPELEKSPSEYSTAKNDVSYCATVETSRHLPFSRKENFRYRAVGAAFGFGSDYGA
ncbi:MAG: hypothetical protein M1829_005273 [Trizodia sp. TS-e1964]|nr:MAG: hypothetical protein M1829_005273 [Trizodia sp. TS-e1964]